MTAAAIMFLQPAVQHIGVHAVLTGQCRDGCTGHLAGRHQLGLELGRVGSMGAPGRITGNSWVFEHGVHDLLRAHDLARLLSIHQDGIAGRLHST